MSCHILTIDRDLYARMFGALNRKTRFDLLPAGQQPIAIIQYSPGDEYG